MKFGDISYTEIRNWAEITRTPVNGWEAETMLRLRGKYESMKYKARKNIPPPYIADVDARIESQWQTLWSSIPRKTPGVREKREAAGG